MIGDRISMRTSLVAGLLAMGAVTALLAYSGAEVYRAFVLDTQHAALADQLRLQIGNARDDVDMRVRGLFHHAQSLAAFDSPLATRPGVTLVRQLDELQRHFSVALEGPRASALYAYDNQTGALLAVSSLHPMAPAEPPCRNAVTHAPPVSGRAFMRLCLDGDKPYFVAALSLPARANGYLYLVGEYLPVLRSTERQFGAALRLRNDDGRVLYQSSLWPATPTPEQYAVADVPFTVYGPKPMSLHLDATRDISPLLERLMNLRYLVILAVAIAVTIIVLIALFALERATLQPLRALTVQLRRILHDKRNLGEQVNIRGNAEVVELAGGFNEMTTRLRELYESLERMAFTDALTGLPNRSLFRDHLQQSILTARRDARPFALLIMDLDRFKDINDTLGHQTGDALLVQVAQRLRGKLRASDTVARMGGDEFAILLPNVDVKHAGMAARMLLQSLRAPFAVDEQNLSIGASIGIVFYPEHGVDGSVLMQRADVAMYAAKESGSGYMFYNPTIDQNFPTRLMMLSDLRQALELEQFELFYQPIVNLERDRVTGVEALVRWRHPVNGMLLPDSFIPLLEQSGLIRSLMPWVLNEALSRVHALQAAGFPLTVSVNLSMRDLQDPYIVESFAEQFEAREVDPRLIVLEVTESAVMTDAPRTLELLNRLSAMGLKIAVDDFGTGYSSLSYLKRLPVNLLKIDKSFIMAMTTSDNDAAIVRTSIELAHNLGLEVVAEGVETDAALKQLKALGCDMAQGHYVGRPLTATELEDWLLQSAWGYKGVTFKQDAPPRFLS